MQFTTEQKKLLVETLAESVERAIDDTINDAGKYQSLSDVDLLKDHMNRMVMLYDLNIEAGCMSQDEIVELHDGYVSMLVDDLAMNQAEDDHSWEQEHIAALLVLGERDQAERWRKTYEYEEAEIMKLYSDFCDDFRSSGYGDLISQYESMELAERWLKTYENEEKEREQ